MGNKLERKEMDLRSQSGFTLIEVMSVLVILGVMFSVTIHKFTDLSDTAYQKTLESAIKELNIRETLTWFDFKLSIDGWESDDDIFTSVDKKLGGDIYLDPSDDKLGGSLSFGPNTIALVRTQSTNKSAGFWK